MKTQLKLMTMALLVSSGAFAKTTSKKSVPTSAQILEKYSYTQLQEAATYFAMRVQFPKKKILKCDVPVKSAKNWLENSVHGFIEQKKDPTVKDYVANPAASSPQIKSCANACQCTAFYGILEEADESLKSNEIHQKNFAVLKEEIKKQDDKQELACSKKATWICGSSLLQHLKSTH